jgi:hypothetical protein
VDTKNTEYNLEIKKETEERKLLWLTKVHDIFEMRPGSHNLCATLKESRAQNKSLTGIGYISNT